jgi:hypothetical protein
MNKSALEAIEQNLSHVLRRRADLKWPDELLIVRTDGSVLDPTGELTSVDILSELEDDDFGDKTSLYADEAYRESTFDNRKTIYDLILHQDIDGASLDVELNKILTSLSETFGGDFPGAPGHASSLGRSASYAPTPDVYAFYLPWHYFDATRWGIYLIVEGIDDFARQLYAAAGPYLSFPDCKRVAKQFLFHHVKLARFRGQNEIGDQAALSMYRRSNSTGEMNPIDVCRRRGL